MDACLTAIGQGTADGPCNCAKPPIDNVFRIRRVSRDPRCHQAEIYGMNHRGETERNLKATNDVHGSCFSTKKYRECHQAQPTKMIVLSANKSQMHKICTVSHGLNKDHKAIVLKLA